MSSIIFNHATVRQRADLVEFVRLCADRGLKTVSVWGDEIEKVGEATALQVLRDNGMSVAGYNRIGPFDRNGLACADRELERAARFGADHVFLFTGGLLEVDRTLHDARLRAEDTIAGLLEKARGYGVKLAIEPLHPMLAGDRATISTLTHSNNICDQLGAGIGIVVDVYHVWWDERLACEINRAGQNNRILGFHVNDWLVPTRHLLTDRGMMGDGVIDLSSIDAMVRAAGYTGPVEVEIFSEDWWAKDPAEVIDIALDRCAQIFSRKKAV